MWTKCLKRPLIIENQIFKGNRSGIVRPFELKWNNRIQFYFWTFSDKRKEQHVSLIKFFLSLLRRRNFTVVTGIKGLLLQFCLKCSRRLMKINTVRSYFSSVVLWNMFHWLRWDKRLASVKMSKREHSCRSVGL